MSQAQPAEAATSSLGHADRVAPRSGALERARYLARHLILFGANRVVGQLPGHALRLAYLRHALGWSIGERSSVHHGLKIFGGRGRVRIGDRSTLQMDCLVVGAGMADLIIGNRVAIAYRASLIMGGHDVYSPTFAGITGPITIEDYVFVGSGAIDSAWRHPRRRDRCHGRLCRHQKHAAVFDCSRQSRAGGGTPAARPGLLCRALLAVPLTPRSPTMDFDFTPDQKEIRGDVAAFARAELNAGLLEDDQAGRFSRDKWQKAARFGLHGLPMPERYGGTDRDLLTRSARWRDWATAVATTA